MYTQNEEDSDFLDMVYTSLQKSAKEAHRIAEFTGTKLVSIDIAEPMIPEGMKEFLHSLGQTKTMDDDNKRL